MALTQGGWLKWLVLQWLSRRAQPEIRRYSLASNQGFTGVLFTGQIAGKPLHTAWNFSSRSPKPGCIPPLLLHIPVQNSMLR